MNGTGVDPALEMEVLRAENTRLIALLESHGIDWRLPQPTPLVAREQASSRLSTAEKVALFRRLFRGRTDVFSVRWESKTTGKAGYAPACANEWRAGVCEKPRIKWGLRESAADPAFRRRGLRPSGGWAHGWGVPAAGSIAGASWHDS